MRRSTFLVLGMVMSAVTGAANAEDAVREGARLVILDTCVMASSTKDKTFTDFAKTCQCASKKAVDEMSPSTQARVQKSGSLGFGDAGAWRKHMDDCGTK